MKRAFLLKIPAYLPVRAASEAKYLFPKGRGFVIQSPLTIGSQKQITLCDLCGFAVNLVFVIVPWTSKTLIKSTPVQAIRT